MPPAIADTTTTCLRTCLCVVPRFIADGATIDVWTISKSVITGTTVTTRHNLKYLSFLFLRNSLFDFFWRVASTL